MNIHELSGSLIILVFGRSWTRLTVHEFNECLICCSGTFMNSSWTHLMNVHECSLTIWFMNLSSSWSFMNLPWFMNYLSSWPFMNNTCSWTKCKFMNKISSWAFMKVSFVVQEYSWTVHEHVDERSWKFIVFCSRTFMNYSWMFMNSSWSSHRGVHGLFMKIR